MQQFHLEHATFPGQEQAISEIVALALQVAKHQRNEDRLQPHDVLKGKLLREYAEFEEALQTKSRLDTLSELADITYYNTCSFALDGDERNLHEVQWYICRRAGVTVEQAYQVTLAKYRLRAASQRSKDFESENEAIRQTLEGGAA